MRCSEAGGVLAHVDADRGPAPLVSDVEEGADVAADLDHVRAGRKHRPEPSLLRPVCIDLHAEHPLHDIRRVRIGLEVAPVVLANEDVAVLADADRRRGVVEDVEAVLHLRAVNRAVDAGGEELLPELQLLRDTRARGEGCKLD